MEIRGAHAKDATPLAVLFQSYVSEAFGADWAGSPEQFAKDIASQDARVLVAENGTRTLVGFVAWARSYDFHHCVRGGTIEDLYIVPQVRNQGLGVRLVLAVAGKIHENGGVFLRGMSVDAPAVAKLYERVAVCHGTQECTISGRAFRRLVELRGRTLREIAGQLPEPAWNYEA